MISDLENDIQKIQDRDARVSKVFSPNAKAVANASPKAGLASRVLGGIKNKVIDKVSDVMSYPARRAAQKSILNDNKELSFIKSAQSKGYGVKRENKLGGGTELIATPKARQQAALKRAAPQLSQRDRYARAMNRAQRNGGSNGVAVGY